MGLERIEGGAKLLVLLIIHNALKTTSRVDRPEGGLQGRELDTLASIDRGGIYGAIVM